MVITPTLRGLFGISIDAQSKTITVNPRLPAEWKQAGVSNLQIPGGWAALSFTKRSDRLEVELNTQDGDQWTLKSDLPGATIGPIDTGAASFNRIRPSDGLRIPTPALEVNYVDPEMDLIDPVDQAAPTRAPSPGARTEKFRVVRSDAAERKLTLIIEGTAGSNGILGLIRHGHLIPELKTDPPSDPKAASPVASISYRDCDSDFYACKWMPLVLHFPPGEGWKTITVTLTW
jgi:hypothetical protein